MSYVPRPAPSDPAQLPGYLLQELQNLQNALEAARRSLVFQKVYAEPSKKPEGLTVHADGTTWDPGSGAGTYQWRDGAWRAWEGGGGGGGSLSDGDKGDITVSGGGTVWNIDAGVVTTTELGGDITTAGKALLDDANAAAQRTTLGLTTAATAIVGQVVVTVPLNSFEHSETVTFTGCDTSRFITATLAPHADSDENDPEMLDLKSLSVAAGTNQAIVEITFSEPTTGPVRINLMAA